MKKNFLQTLVEVIFRYQQIFCVDFWEPLENIFVKVKFCNLLFAMGVGGSVPKKGPMDLSGNNHHHVYKTNIHFLAEKCTF